MSKKQKKAKRLFKPEKKFTQQLKKILGFTPRKLFYYQLAFIHKSVANKLLKDATLNNERLEFLGDAILDSVIAEHLYHRFPDEDEGFLTQMRSKIVNRDTLKRIALKLGLGNLVLSRTTNENHKSLYGDALEALIGALYLDKGYKKTRKFILTKIIDHHINLSKLTQTEVDFKSRIIEWGQKNKKEINFTCQEQLEGDAKIPMFVSHLLIFDEIAGMGIGKSKKEAEQGAARQALQNIE